MTNQAGVEKMILNSELHPISKSPQPRKRWGNLQEHLAAATFRSHRISKKSPVS
ncbi:hypothetical protein [Ralstonia pseudosolanacearum]